VQQKVIVANRSEFLQPTVPHVRAPFALTRVPAAYANFLGTRFAPKGRATNLGNRRFLQSLQHNKKARIQILASDISLAAD